MAKKNNEEIKLKRKDYLKQYNEVNKEKINKRARENYLKNKKLNNI